MAPRILQLAHCTSDAPSSVRTFGLRFNSETQNRAEGELGEAKL